MMGIYLEHVRTMNLRHLDNKSIRYMIHSIPTTPSNWKSNHAQFSAGFHDCAGASHPTYTGKGRAVVVGTA